MTWKARGIRKRYKKAKAYQTELKWIHQWDRMNRMWRRIGGA